MLIFTIVAKFAIAFYLFDVRSCGPNKINEAGAGDDVLITKNF